MSRRDTRNGPPGRRFGAVSGVSTILALVLLTACTSNEPPDTAPAPSSPTVSTTAKEKPWDPRDVDDLPAAGDEVAPALVAQVDPPDEAPALGRRPMAAAVLSVDRRGGRIQLLGQDGSWRELRVPSPHGRLALSQVELSRDGTRLAALLDDGIEVWHLPTGTRTVLPLPAPFEPWDYSWISWVDDDSLLLDDLEGGWRIDTISGAADKTPYPTGMSFGWTVDDRGAVVEVSDPSEEDVLTDWGGGVRRRVDMSPTGHLSSLQVEGDTVVGTSFDHGDFAVHVADRADLNPLHVLPVRDHEANYSNWALRTVDILDDGSVLLWVAVPSRNRDVDGWRIVSWDPASDDLEVVTRSEGDPTQPMTFAADLFDDPWDPRKVDDLPAAPADVAPLLPDVLEVPESSPTLTSSPVDAAVLSVFEKETIHVLASDGTWRRLTARPGSGSAELTRDGTRLAVPRRDGVDVWDLASAEHTWVPVPPGHVPWEYTSWRWVDNETLLLDEPGGGWLVSTLSGSADAVPYPSRTSFYWAVDAGGEVVESAQWGNPSVLTDWAGGVRRRIDMSATGRLASLQATADTVVGTSYENGPFAVYVADRDDLAPADVLRVHDHDANYSNGGLSVLAALEDGTVLLRVSVFSGPGMQWRIVAWDPDTDDLSIVSRTNGTVALSAIAHDLLG